MKYKDEENFAIVSRNVDWRWIGFYEWTGVDTKKYTGHFVSVEDAIRDVPEKYKKIKVQITYDDGKQLSYTILRDESGVAQIDTQNKNRMGVKEFSLHSSGTGIYVDGRLKSLEDIVKMLYAYEEAISVVKG